MPQQPHIIYLMADQLRYDVLGCNGLSRLFTRKAPQLTPALDKLAATSTWLDRHFTPCPLCVPARSSIMTGLHTHQHGAIVNGWLPGERSHGMIRADLPLLPQSLADAGYRVAHIGVQHVRSEPNFATRQPDVEFIGPFGHGAHRGELQRRGLHLEDPTPFKDPVIEYDNGKPVIFTGTNPDVGIFPLVEDLYYDCQLTESMVQTVRNHRPHDGPLAMFGMFWLPHPPFVAPRQWAELIDMTHLKLPPTVGRWLGSTPTSQLQNFPGQLGAHVTMPQWQQAWAVYLGMVALLDKCIGRVLAALDEQDMLDDCLLIVTSDHGEMLGCRRMFQKMCCYEESIRVPAMIKLPGQTTSRRVLELTHHLDFTATMLDAAGAEPIDHCSGRPLTNLASGHAHRDDLRPFVFATYDGNAGRAFPTRMCRSRSHKLIHNVGDVPELYDLVDDPRETINLYNHPDHHDAQQQLRDALNRWMDDCNDDQPRV